MKVFLNDLHFPLVFNLCCSFALHFHTYLFPDSVPVQFNCNCFYIGPEVFEMSTKSRKQKSQAKNLQMNNPEEEKMENPKETIENASTENVSTDSINSVSSKEGEGPLRMKRIDEKNTLIGLNNRFAAIIEKNHQLEHANNTLTKEVHKAEENLSLTVTRLETTFAKELDDSQKLYLEAQKENAKLQMNETKTQKELLELKNKLEKKDKDADTLKKKLALIDEKITKLSAEVQEASERNLTLTKDNKDLEEEKFRLTQELTEIRCKYEEECLSNVDLQNQLKSKIEENSIKVQLFEQEILQVKNKRKLEIQEIDGKLKKEYELKLQELLNELRADYDKELQRNKEDQKDLYSKKENDLISQINKLSEIISSKLQELELLQSKFDEANQKLAALEGDKHSLNINIKELEKKYNQDKENYVKDKKKVEAENDQLRKEKDELIGQYLDLVDAKTVLDNEISTYRLLLEGEEERLSMSPDASEPTKTDINENVVEKQDENNFVEKQNEENLIV